MGTLGGPEGLTFSGPGSRVTYLGVDQGGSSKGQAPDPPRSPLGGEVEGGLEAVVEEEGRRSPPDSSSAAVSLDQLGLQLVSEEVVGVEPQDASGAEGSPDVGPGVAEGDEDIGVGPAVESTLGAVVAKVELDAGSDQASELGGEQWREDKRWGGRVDGESKGGAQLVDGEFKSEGDRLVGEEADALDREALSTTLLQEESKVAQDASQLFRLGVAVVVDEVAAGTAAPFDVAANEPRSVANVELRGGDGALKGRLGSEGVPCSIEEEKGAAGVEKSRGLAAPAGAMAEVRRGGDPWGSVEAEEGSLGVVCGLEKSFEPASEAVDLLEPVVSGLARGVVESKTSGVLERGGEQKSRGIDGARGKEESLGIAGRVEFEELVKREVVGGIGQRPKDR